MKNGTDEEAARLRARLEAMEGLMPDSLRQEWLGPQANPDILFPVAPHKDLPPVLLRDPEVLLQSLVPLHPCQMILGLEGLNVQDTLELLWRGKGLITHLELFNLRTWSKGQLPHIEAINELQRAIELIHQEFQHSLCVRLNLHRVSAPLFVDGRTGLNDALTGVERPVSFDIPDVGTDGQVVHSLAKWKRLALKRYEFPEGTGLYTNMNAIRRDEEVDNLHSIYVDQWDWEKHISPKDRNVLYLKETVRDIVGAICDTSAALRNAFPALTFKPDRDVYFITTQELEDRYPDLTPNEREVEICRKHHTVFLMQIGKTLASGKRHDGRAPDYDDWELNGDILMWNPILERSFELSSMGIRVDAQALDRQLRLAGCDERRNLPFHQMLLNGELPQSIGGGIGQSRLCMLLLGKAHIGEVQSSIWDQETFDVCNAAGVTLL